MKGWGELLRNLTTMKDADKISKAAANFVRRYGSDAPRQALIRANELHTAGLTEDGSSWMQIHGEIVAILKGMAEQRKP